MKVVCISASQVPSTTANSMQVMKACQAIAQLGHAVSLLVPENPNAPESIDLSSYYGLTKSIEIERLTSTPRLHRYDFSYKAVRRAKHRGVEICYVWLVQSAIFALMAGLPVVYELHGPPEGRFGPMLFRLFLGLPGKKRLLPITQALSKQVAAQYRIAEERMVASPNGVDLERYSRLPDPPVARDQLGLPALPTAGYTGHLYPGRGMNLLVELAKRFPQVSFVWVGGRPADVEAWRMKLADVKVTNIHLAGFVENSRLPMYQAACELLLMPYERRITGSSGGDSTAYASPMKMFEYMACRRGIISSDLPVIREVLNASNAVLCPAEDVDSWAQALAELVANPDHRLALAQKAGEDVQKYTWLERARKALAGFMG